MFSPSGKVKNRELYLESGLGTKEKEKGKAPATTLKAILLLDEKAVPRNNKTRKTRKYDFNFNVS